MTEKTRLLGQLIQYLIEENFSTKHLRALNRIAVMFNDNAEAERDVFEFAQHLIDTYAVPSRRGKE